jgi:hypothetical protein
MWRRRLGLLVPSGCCSWLGWLLQQGYLQRLCRL